MYIHCITPLFVIYLFRVHYFAYIYFAFYYLYLVISQSLICYLFNYNSLLFGDFKICRQKNPRFRGGLVVCYEDYYEGGFYLRLRLENFNVLASLFEAVKVDFDTFCHSLRC